MTSNQRIIQKLREARALIEQGWCQRIAKFSFTDGHTLYCPIGALYEVKEDQSYFYALDALVRAIEYEDIGAWNDDPYRTKEDVLSAFDHAIDLVLAKEKEFPSEL